LEPVPKPPTVLDDEIVRTWFEKAETLDHPYCDQLKSLIRQQSFDIGTRVHVPKWMEASVSLVVILHPVKPTPDF
jgi:hypothetical protein